MLSFYINSFRTIEFFSLQSRAWSH